MTSTIKAKHMFLPFPFFMILFFCQFNTLEGNQKSNITPDTSSIDTTHLIPDSAQTLLPSNTPIKSESKFYLPNLRYEEPPSRSSFLKEDTILEEDTIAIPTEIKPFFEYESEIPGIQAQIDSLKTLMKLYETEQTLPTIKEELLNLIQVPESLHRITLQNGTVVIGEIIDEKDDEIILKTNIGRLVLNHNSILRIDEESPPSANIEFISEPKVQSFAGKEIITGTVINKGDGQGDFVRIIANLWTETTGLASQDSAFIDGSQITFDSGVITDTALQPEKVAAFKIFIKVPTDKKIQYRTFDIKWEDRK